MGELSRCDASTVGPRRAPRWLAALPFVLGLSIAAVSLNEALSPLPGQELRLDHPPAAAPASPPATHHDDLVYDSSELITV
jgi:hypothetical protein